MQFTPKMRITKAHKNERIDKIEPISNYNHDIIIRYSSTRDLC